MSVSGVRSALDSLMIGPATIFSGASGPPVPCAAFCSGTTQEESAAAAQRLIAAGHTTLKVKIGTGRIEEDVERCRAVLDAAAGGARLRIDANQGLNEADLKSFLKNMPAVGVELLEQPFPANFDDRMAHYAAESPIPLMLDESIWTAADIERAAALNVAYVKLKLCKHAGVLATIERAKEALAVGLGVVFGNGVQGPVGNRTELYIYRCAGLSAAIESNGFAKLADRGRKSGLALEGGALREDGVTPAMEWARSGELLMEAELKVDMGRVDSAPPFMS